MRRMDVSHIMGFPLLHRRIVQELQTGLAHFTSTVHTTLDHTPSSS